MSHHSQYKLFCLFIIWCSWSCISKLAAQDNFRFEHFTSENGLSENFVYTVFQDSKGFLWIGTHDGLNRYDGYRFKKFRHNPADSNSIPDNTIKSICEDGKGNIWLATNAGLCRYDPAKNVFLRFALQRNSNDVRKIIMCDKMSLIVQYLTTFSVIDIHTLKESSVDFKTDDLKFSYWQGLHSMTKDTRGNIFTANSRDGFIYVWRYDSIQRRFMGFKRLPVDKSWQEKEILSFFIDSRNTCWIAIINAEIIMYPLSENVIESILLEPKSIPNTTSDFYEDRDGNIWIMSKAGLRIYNHNTGKTSRYFHDNAPGAISADVIQSVIQDRTGTIWIGTSNGLNKVNPLQSKFRHLVADHPPALFNNFVLGIYQEKNNQVRIDYDFRKQYYSMFDSRNNSIRHYPIQSYPYADYIIEALVKNPGRLNESKLKKSIAGLIKNGSLFIDSGGNPWYNTGYWVMDLKTRKVWSLQFLIEYSQTNGDGIWMATNGDGLVCFNTRSRSMIKFSSGASKSNSISSNDITCFVFEDNNDMWIGTKGGGLNYFNSREKTFQHYTEDEGLCNNSIYCMVKDDHGRLWIGTSYGLSCFDPAMKKFRNYFRSDGLVNSEYNRHSACKLADGTVMMGGMNGIDYFHPDSLMDNAIPPQVHVTDFKVFDKSISPAKNLSLAHNENFITVEFAAMDFSNPSRNKFMCKLEGADRDWLLLENRNSTTYTYLKPGSYRFLVKGANSDGVWNEKPAVYHFDILPPWYQTVWFRIMAGLFLLGAVLLAVRFYTKRKLEKQRLLLEKQKAVEGERMRISTELHDDIGGELSAIRLLSEMNVANITPEQQLTKISSSSGELVQKMNEIVWALNVNNDSLQGLIAYLRRYGVKYLDDLGIDCEFKQPDKIPAIEVDGVTRRNVFLLVKETLNNVVKHAGATDVQVTVAVDNELRIVIHDNGKGIADNMLQNGSGNGLRNMQQRVRELKGSLEIKNHEGTTVQFFIPLLMTQKGD
jgi:signal transduction histidine kinase/ligand-binding sensor domain-containing protein